MFRWLVLWLLAAPCVLRAEVAKVACVGDSVTYGYGLAHRDQDAYPVVLQRLLGPGFETRNFGVSGTTLLREGHHPYAGTAEFQEALAWHPDVVVIHLGLNDTDPRDWPSYRDAYRGDYSWLIGQFRKSNPSVRIFIGKLTPIFESHPRFRSGTEVWAEQIRQEIPQIAEANGVHVVDLYAPLKDRPDLFPDAVHPDAKGAAFLAKSVAEEITGRFGGLQLPEGFGDHMVLPHGRTLDIHGVADRDEIVTLQFRGRKWTARAGFDGKWMIQLPAQQPGGPYSITVSTPSRRVRLDDVLFGVVWLCSGQSNMDFPVSRAAERNDALASDGDSSIRLFHLRNLVETDDSEWSPVALEKVNDLQYFSGSWSRPDANAVDAFSAVGYFFALRLQKALHIPVGIVQVSVGGSELASWIDRKTMDEDPLLVNFFSDWRRSDFIMDWCRERAGKNLALATSPRQRHPYQPSYNFEAGIAPLRYLPVNGVIWYQGESDAQNPELYGHMFPLLVASWRRQWGDDLPFFYVQLSGLNRPSWPRFRDEQRRALGAIPRSGMAVSYDMGDETNVHYLRKRAVGERLAGLALHRVYGLRGVHGAGPAIGRTYFSGDRLILQLDNTGGALRASDGKAVRGFQVEDAKGEWRMVPATVKGSQIILDGIQPKSFLAVAYAWKPFPDANLVSAYGLPVSTFLLKASEVGERGHEFVAARDRSLTLSTALHAGR